MACLAGPSFHEANGSAACAAIVTKTTMQASATVTRFGLPAEALAKAGVCLVFIALNFLIYRFPKISEERSLQNWPEHRNGVVPKPAGHRPLGHRLGGDGMGAGEIGVLTTAHFGS